MTERNAIIGPGDPGHAEAVNLSHKIHAVIAEYLEAHGHDPQCRANAVASLQLIAGAQIGALLGMGHIEPDDLSNFLAMAGGNIREGMRLGAQSAAEALREEGLQ